MEMLNCYLQDALFESTLLHISQCQREQVMILCELTRMGNQTPNPSWKANPTFIRLLKILGGREVQSVPFWSLSFPAWGSSMSVRVCYRYTGILLLRIGRSWTTLDIINGVAHTNNLSIPRCKVTLRRTIPSLPNLPALTIFSQQILLHFYYSKDYLKELLGVFVNFPNTHPT